VTPTEGAVFSDGAFRMPRTIPATLD